MTPLTPAQQDVLDHVKARIENDLLAPTCQEIAREFCWPYMTAYRCVIALEEKGYITRQLGKRRGIRIAAQPDPVKMIHALRTIRSKCTWQHMSDAQREIVAICDGALS